MPLFYIGMGLSLDIPLVGIGNFPGEWCLAYFDIATMSVFGFRFPWRFKTRSTLRSLFQGLKLSICWIHYNQKCFNQGFSNIDWHGEKLNWCYRRPHRQSMDKLAANHFPCGMIPTTLGALHWEIQQDVIPILFPWLMPRNEDAMVYGLLPDS